MKVSAFHRLLAFAILTVCTGAAQAATLYVATTGNDSNPGTQAQPFRTIAYGITVAVNGDTVRVAAGTYAENLSSDKDLILQGAGVGQSIIDGGAVGGCLILYGVPSTTRVAGLPSRMAKPPETWALD